MTTEDDFQAMLDAERFDRLNFTVFADWLDDRDDPRGEGYRALGALGKSPIAHGKSLYSGVRWWNGDRCESAGDDPESDLPRDWFKLLRGGKPQGFSREYGSQPEARNAAALAFSLLLPERRAELLNPQPAQVA